MHSGMPHAPCPRRSARVPQVSPASHVCQPHLGRLSRLHHFWMRCPSMLQSVSLSCHGHACTRESTPTLSPLAHVIAPCPRHCPSPTSLPLTHVIAPRPHHRPLPTSSPLAHVIAPRPRCCPTWPPHQPMASKRAGVPYPGSLHAPSPHRWPPLHLCPSHSASHGPMQTCPGPSDSPALSQCATAIQACLACPSRAPAPATTSCMCCGPLRRIPAAPMCPAPFPAHPCATAPPLCVLHGSYMPPRCLSCLCRSLTSGLDCAAALVPRIFALALAPLSRRASTSPSHPARSSRMPLSHMYRCRALSHSWLRLTPHLNHALIPRASHQPLFTCAMSTMALSPFMPLSPFTPAPLFTPAPRPGPVHLCRPIGLGPGLCLCIIHPGPRLSRFQPLRQVYGTCPCASALIPHNLRLPVPRCSMLTIASFMHVTHPLVLSHHRPILLQSPSASIISVIIMQIRQIYQFFNMLTLKFELGL